MAGAAAHEINNPLAVIQARLELLISDLEETEPLRQDLEKVEDLVHRIADVVKKMGQVRRYQVQNYAGGINILDLDRASGEE